MTDTPEGGSPSREPGSRRPPIQLAGRSLENLRVDMVLDRDAAKAEIVFTEQDGLEVAFLTLPVEFYERSFQEGDSLAQGKGPALIVRSDIFEV